MSAASPVPLAALLANADWQQVSVLATPPAPALTVGGVAVVADIRGRAADLEGNLLTVLQPPLRDDWHIDVLIQTAAAGRASALLIGDSSPLSQPSSAAPGGRSTAPSRRARPAGWRGSGPRPR